MVPEIGHFALILALVMASMQGILPLFGAARRNAAWIATARPIAQGQFAFVAIAFACLTTSFVNSDFSVLNVAANSSSHLPLAYRFAATWGSHEGSMLLWVLILSVWGVAVTLFSQHLPEEIVARVLGVMGILSVGFLIFILFASNPFQRLFPTPLEGNDLNPLLQDPGMVIHPPILYMGYVGFSVAFAFAIAALLSARLDTTWARWSRPWTTVAWVFLTLGIMLGSGWAYYELGWGGWWFWDPVENASFMPWLVGTALIHSLAVTEKRGGFKSWTVLLAIAAFSLSLLGTFLVRSGVLTSVHAFATDPKRGVFILAFLSCVIGGSLLLFAWRAPRIGLGGKFDLVSRETLLLCNNVLLITAAASVLFGTLYPLLHDVLGLGKISVGPPYFNLIFVPLLVPAVFLMAIGPMAHWKKTSVPDLAVRLRWAFYASIVSALILPFILGDWRPLIALGLLLATWVIFSGAINLSDRIQLFGEFKSILTRIAKQPASYYGMQFAHLGVAIFILGVTIVKGYETQKDVRMEIGERVTVGAYAFQFNGVSEVSGPNYKVRRGSFNVYKNAVLESVLYPEKRLYQTSDMELTEAAIDTGIFRDLYVSLGEPLDGGAWSVRVYYKPLIRWIWGGFFIMAFGGLLATFDQRYRFTRRKQAVVTQLAAPDPNSS